MVDLPTMIDRISNWGEFCQRYWSLDWPINPNLSVWIAVLVGLTLALWGARLLHAVYVLTLMGVGVAIGIHLAKQWEVDLLIGLVLGGGLLGLLGHLLYRWLVGLTAGLCVALVVLMIGAPWLADSAEAFADDHLARVNRERIFTTEQLMPSAPTADLAQGVPEPVLGAQAFVTGLAEKLWQKRHSESTKLVILVAVSILLGIALGVVLPRFTTIVGTSVVGVGVLTSGLAALLGRYLPNVWGSIQANPTWALGGMGLMLLMALLYQTRHGRIREVVLASTAAQAG